MILRALKSSPPDVATLRQLAISRGGLLDNDLRQKAWPTLLNIDVTKIPSKPGSLFLLWRQRIIVIIIIIIIVFIIKFIIIITFLIIFIIIIVSIIIILVLM